jgi:hypothetical protein
VGSVLLNPKSAILMTPVFWTKLVLVLYTLPPTMKFPG